jgi:hypothetical protein
LRPYNLVGVVPSAGAVHKCVVELGKEEYARDPEAYQHSLSTLVSFAKLFREEFLGLGATDTEVGEGRD